MNKLLSFESFNYENITSIEKIKKEDVDSVMDILWESFGHLGGTKEEMFKKLEKRIFNGLSICLKQNSKVCGVYLLNEKSINEFIQQIEKNEISDFPKNETKIYLNESVSDNGLQGIALCVSESKRGLGYGELLKEYTYNMGYDYVWGVQDKKLNNIEFWKKTREVFAESNSRFATYKKLKKVKIKKEGWLFNIFNAYYVDPMWVEKIKYLKGVVNDLPHIVKPSMGGHGGYGGQLFLDLKDENEADKLANKLFEETNGQIIVVYKKISLTIKKAPIGEHYEKSLIAPGEFFDERVRKKEYGIYKL